MFHCRDQFSVGDIIDKSQPAAVKPRMENHVFTVLRKRDTKKNHSGINIEAFYEFWCLAKYCRAKRIDGC